MQLLDFTLAVNTTRPIEAPGTYIYYYSGVASGSDPTITIKEDTGASTINLKPGQAYRLPDGSRPATRWYVTNFANTGTIIGTVVIGSGEITDNRVTGDVNVTDSTKGRVEANNSFATTVYCGPVAGQFSHSIIWNPVASTKKIAARLMSIYSGTASTTVQLRRFNAVLAGWTLVTPETRNINSAVAAQHQCYFLNNAALQGTVTNLPATNIAAGVSTFMPRQDDPYVLLPGNGLLVTSNVLATDTNGTWSVEEYN